MISLVIDNSYSQVVGLKPEAFKALREALSYRPDAQATFFSGRPPALRYCIDKKGFFASGLLIRVKEFMAKHGIAHTISDKRVKPSISPILAPPLPIKPHQYQVEAVERAFAKGRGGLEMVTGSGKSITMALLINRFQLKTLVIVPNLGLKEQLTATFKALFGNLKNITVENIDSPRLKTATNYDLLLIDEAHHSSSKTYRDLNRTAWKNIYHRFFFTGTFFRNQEEEALLFESIAGRLIFSFGYQAGVAAKTIVPVESYYIEVPKQETDGYTWAQVYKELVINNHARNALIATLMASLQAAEAYTLCLVKEIAHGNILSELTGIPFVNGQDEETKKYINLFNAGKIKALIGTTGVIGEGIDTKPCEYVIIAGLGKAKSAFQQQVGRGIRTYPGKESAKIIIFKDKSHKFTLTHFNTEAKLLKEEYQSKPEKLEI